MSDPESTFDGITWPDYLVIGAYFGIILAVGLFSSWKSKKNSVEGYFLSGRSMHFIPVGASLFASNIGSGHFIGLAGSGAASGVGIAGFELTAPFYLMLLGWYFLPVYMVSGVYTMPEYIRKRFGGQRIRIYLSVLAILLYVFTKISADLFAGALFITQATQIEGDSAIYIAILILLAMASVFTVVGGLTAVIWTDFVQVVLMVIGALTLCGIAFYDTGGYEQMISDYFHAIADNRTRSDPADENSPYCAEPPDYAMHIFRSPVPGESDLPWTGLVFGLAITSIWYWCSDQVIVQRSLASKSMVHAKGGTIFASYFKFLPMWIMVFPGMASRVLFPNSVACATPELCEEVCGAKGGCTNIAFIKLVNEKMPEGLRGLMLAVMLAALMSSLTSIFNSASTIFTLDIYKRMRENAPETELLIAGRCFVLVLVGISIAWIPVITHAQNARLFDYIQATTSYLAPPICAIYLLALFWPRCNEPGAFWGLMVGLVVGLIRFGLEFGYSKPACGTGDPKPPDWWYKIVDDIHYLHFGILLWGITGIVTITISLLTDPIPKKHLYRLTYWSRFSDKVREDLDEGDEIRQQEEESSSEGSRRSSDSSTSSDAVNGCCRRTVDILCSVSKADPVDLTLEPELRKTPEEKAKEAAEFLQEPSLWKRVVDLNAVVVLCLVAFNLGFYF